MPANAEILIEKIHALPPDRLAEVADFVDFIRIREQQRSLTKVSTKVSEPAFAKVWDNSEDEVYDAL